MMVASIKTFTPGKVASSSIDYHDIIASKPQSLEALLFWGTTPCHMNTSFTLIIFSMGFIKNSNNNSIRH